MQMMANGVFAGSVAYGVGAILQVRPIFTRKVYIFASNFQDFLGNSAVG